MTIVKLELCSVVMIMLLTNAFAQDQNACSATTIKGDYGFVSSVRLIPPPNSTAKHTERSRFIGVISYDGAGNAKVGGITVAPNGKTAAYSGSGTYSVDAAHCTGSVSFQNAEDNNSKWDFVIVSSGTQLLTIIQTAASTSPFAQIKR